MARRSHLVRMRLASVLSQAERWMTCEEIKNRFLDEGWSFTSSNQISRLCVNTIGFKSRMDEQGVHYYKIENLDAFHHWMKQKPIYGN